MDERLEATPVRGMIAIISHKNKCCYEDTVDLDKRFT